MSVCPVCQYQHQEEVSKCQRCNWSMQDSLDSIGISRENPILKICIPTLIQSLEDKTTQYEKLNSIIQNIDLQESDSRKLNEILEQLEKDRRQTDEQFANLNETINNLKLSLESQKNNSNLEEKTEDNSLSTTDDLLESNNVSKQEIKTESNNIQSFIQNNYEINTINSLVDYRENKNQSSAILSSDRDQNQVSDQDFNPQEGNLYNQSDRESSQNLYSQENTRAEVKFNDSYENFYHLIEKKQIKYTEASVTKESMEKLRGGTLSELKFSNYPRGNYWIIDWKNTYCLIPSKQTIINPYQYGNFQRIFECTNYHEEYSKFKLIKPATVVKSDDETWQLDTKGKIEFS